MKNESRIIGAEINMKDNSASIRESKLPLDEDDQLLMRGCLWMRMTNCWCGGGGGGAGGGIGVGNIGLFNEIAADFKGCLFLYFSNVSIFLYFYIWLLIFLKFIIQILEKYFIYNINPIFIWIFFL